MRWLDLPALAEFEDRFGTVRRIYGPSVLGRYHFADRMADISRLLGEAEGSWAKLYTQNPALKAAIDGALECWGLDVQYLAESQIEALLLYRLDGEVAKSGWLMELLDNGDGKGKGQTLAETLAAIATHCQSLQEALELADEVPADLLMEVLKSKAEFSEEKASKPDREKDQFLKANFDKLMAEVP
jgi:hypothetical protein